MAEPTAQDLMNFAIATGGNNYISDLNSPTAKNAFVAAINAEARRQLAQQAGKSAVREARERQWLTGERTAESGFLSPAEEEWAKKNPQLLGSQRPTTRELPGGVTSSTLPDGYTVLTDAQGKIIGTNRPLPAAVPYAGETAEEARAAINRGESTAADRMRLGESLRQSIFPQTPTSQPSAPISTAEMTPPIADLMNRLEGSMQPVSPKEEPDLINRLLKASGLSPMTSTRDIPSKAGELAREKYFTKGGLSRALDKDQLAAIQSRVDMKNELEQLQQELSADDQVGQSAGYTAGLSGASPLAGYGRPQRMSQELRTAKLNRIKEIEQTISNQQPDVVSTAAPRTMFLDTLMDRRQRGEAETPAPIAPQLRFLDTLLDRRQRGDAAEAAQQQALIDELLGAVAKEFNPTSERLSKERNDELMRAIGLQHNAASEQLRSARENALKSKQEEWRTSRNPADRIKIWNEIQALQQAMGKAS